jgi:hypothetical protein
MFFSHGLLIDETSNNAASSFVAYPLPCTFIPLRANDEIIYIIIIDQRTQHGLSGMGYPGPTERLSHAIQGPRVRLAFCNPNNDESSCLFFTHFFMESLNLNALAGSLPNSNLANAEKELLNNFRGVFSNPPPCRRLTFLVGSGGTQHYQPLSLLTHNLQALVQLGLRGGMRRPAPDDPARRVRL